MRWEFSNTRSTAVISAIGSKQHLSRKKSIFFGSRVSRRNVLDDLLNRRVEDTPVARIRVESRLPILFRRHIRTAHEITGFRNPSHGTGSYRKRAGLKANSAKRPVVRGLGTKWLYHGYTYSNWKIWKWFPHTIRNLALDHLGFMEVRFACRAGL